MSPQAKAAIFIVVMIVVVSLGFLFSQNLKRIDRAEKSSGKTDLERCLSMKIESVVDDDTLFCYTNSCGHFFFYSTEDYSKFFKK